MSQTTTDRIDLATALWTDGELGGWGSGRERFIAMPGRDDVRQLLPWRWSTLRATFLRSSDDRPLSKQLRDVVGVAGLFSVGALAQSRRVGIAAAGSLVEHVAAELGLERAYGLVLCGPARSNQKPVIQLHDRRGRTIAFVKVAWNDLTLRLIRDERTALEHIARADGIAAPEILAHGEYGSSTWLAIAPVGVERRSDATVESIDQLAMAIERTGRGWTGDVDRSSFVASLRERAVGLPHAEPIVAALAVRDSGTDLTEAGAHGDFVPWNIRSGSPVPAVWDWERYRSYCPTGYDRFHHRLQVAFHRQHRPFPKVLRDLADGVDQIVDDLPVGQRDRHYDWYLTDLLTRYERDVTDHPAPLLPELVGHLHDFLKERIPRP